MAACALRTSVYACRQPGHCSTKRSSRSCGGSKPPRGPAGETPGCERARQEQGRGRDRLSPCLMQRVHRLLHQQCCRCLQIPGQDQDACDALLQDLLQTAPTIIHANRFGDHDGMCLRDTLNQRIAEVRFTDRVMTCLMVIRLRCFCWYQRQQERLIGGYM